MNIDVTVRNLCQKKSFLCFVFDLCFLLFAEPHPKTEIKKFIVFSPWFLYTASCLNVNVTLALPSLY